MKLEKVFIAIAIVAMLLAVPIAFAMKHRSNLLKLERSENSHLKMDIKTKDEKIKAQEEQLQLEQKKSDDLKKQNEEKDKQLQSKRNTSSTVIAQAPKAPVANLAGCEQYRGLVAQYNWNVDVALAVMKAESGCRADATHVNANGSVDHGLFQLNNIAVHDPAENIRIAYQVKYLASGWRPWTVCTSGKVACFG